MDSIVSSQQSIDYVNTGNSNFEKRCLEENIKKLKLKTETALPYFCCVIEVTFIETENTLNPPSPIILSLSY